MFHQIGRTTSLALSITVLLALSRTLVSWRRWRSELRPKRSRFIIGAFGPTLLQISSSQKWHMLCRVGR